MRWVLVVSIGLLSSGVGCSGRREVREWRADDHDQEPQSNSQVAPPPKASGGSAASSSPEDEARALVEATWAQSCAVCHGRFGRGDGPNGPMVKAPDLTAAALQDALSDVQMAATIKSGKGKMPAFPSLPPTVVSGLVRRIRGLRAK